MKRTIVLAIFSLVILASCGGDKNKNSNQAEKGEGKGGRVYGGYLRVSETE